MVEAQLRGGHEHISACIHFNSSIYFTSEVHGACPVTIDVWAQISTERMARAPWLATLWRWTGRAETPVVPTPQSTLAAMDAGGVDIALLSAWYGPEGPLISNEEVAAQI